MRHTKSLLMLMAIGFGIYTSKAPITPLIPWAYTITSYVILIFKWLSLPMIALAMLSAITSFESKGQVVKLGGAIFKYTLLTTIIASTIALILFEILHPTNLDYAKLVTKSPIPLKRNLFGYLLIGTFASTIALGFLSFSFPKTKARRLHSLSSDMYSFLMKGVNQLIKLMPLAIWSFVVLFCETASAKLLSSLLVYLVCLLSSNFIQAAIVLPSFLRFKKISRSKLLKDMWPAISIAFWSKSSSVALPFTLNCAVDRAKMKKDVAHFSFPICTTINMNACSSFILITMLFVATSNGIDLAWWQLGCAVLLATVAAIGNAGVPMGCFTMTMALLGLFQIPLEMMGVVLPLYTMVDMFESAINVWSDSCVTAVVNKELDFIS